MKIILLSVGCFLFFISLVAHIYVRFKYNPNKDSDFDEIYWEFQDSHPLFARFNRLSRITFTGAVLGAILLFLALVF